MFDSHIISVDQDGNITRQQTRLPDSGNIQIRLADDIHDNSIRLINSNSEFQIPIPRTEVHDTISELKKRNLWITFLLFAVAITLVSLITYSITKPLLALNRAAKKISMGELGAQVDIEANKYGQDVSDTINQFNAMSHKLVEYQQQQFNQQELEHFKELSSISRGLAHNLRNPLNTLQLSLEQLESQHPSLSSDKLSLMAKEQVQRIEDWLKAFTLLMEQGIEKQAVAIKSLLQSAIASFNEKNIEIKVAENFQLACVETELAMIIQILLQNAFESYQDASNQAKPILIQAEQSDSEIIISIMDQGKGVSETIKESLFKPYTTDKTYGSGMGLYISRRLIRHRYHGDIVLIDNQPNGTIATIQLPLAGTSNG